MDDNVTHQNINVHLLGSASAADQAVSAALRARQTEAVDELRGLELERLDVPGQDVGSGRGGLKR